MGLRKTVFEMPKHRVHSGTGGFPPPMEGQYINKRMGSWVNGFGNHDFGERMSQQRGKTSSEGAIFSLQLV